MPVHSLILRLDQHLADDSPRETLSGLRRFLHEFWFFGLKEARACLFAGLFFLAVFLVPRAGLAGIARYDLLLIIALLLQAWLIWRKIETPDEARTILIFHLAGFALEVFKVSGANPSWTYPDPALTKVFGVPLFSGFMYAAVGSYIMQAWRILDLRVLHHPPYWMTSTLAVLLYANLFTHHYIGDFRWYLAALALGIYARCNLAFRPLDRERRMPFLLGFILVGFFIWLAENMGTFFGIWRYPNQLGAWATVSLGKWSSWTMLAMMSFAIICSLKHVKERIHLAP
ncbi:DUF817 domain-containing protein [Uliginosibacterium sp. 31-16]|uniref:DUF817 domain-containing protein n=1 Tax=Uliginosibacterium sp. 31-16 TaxID=3068315 RepID=UPI00273FE168|nr:DUF817 domain-containing protein [Uliginosibacterium sp. 31-16]MDP5239759.1 DUF817 domain-containing protein [Uliginosibacterium sp. 31-16]